MHVLDASAFVHGFEVDGETASIPLVGEELEAEHAYRFDAREGAGMHLHVPDPESVDTIDAAARETGDYATLSRTDRRLLAAALELDATLVTDDYAMQNVAGALELAVQPIERDGIDEQRDWIFQCGGCGREFDDAQDRCPICGSDVTRKNPA